MLAGGLLFAAILAAPPAVPGTCELHAERSQWRGSCGALIEGAVATLTIAPTNALTSGAWKREVKPQATWSGTMVAGDDPATPIELEVYVDQKGVLRSVYGWFPLTGFVDDGATLRFRVDSSREVEATTVDRAIIERAKKVLATSADWNRADNRTCPKDAVTWSIYCTLEKATIEVAGAFHHRRPALQIVRQLVDERTAGRPYSHRLMDYNNDPTTTLAEVQSLFNEALRRMAAQAASGKRTAH